MENGLKLISIQMLNGLKFEMVFILGEIASLLSDKNKSREEKISDCVLAVETVTFNVAFMTTFRDWNISQSDDKTKRMTSRFCLPFICLFNLTLKNIGKMSNVCVLYFFFQLKQNLRVVINVPDK